ncbi:tRNA (cytosine(72)-C(5))-methyltransferase NSUN6 isoform X1 [Lepisosteus oculatus]|uniref:NOP2/Sun RNA methyltransferase 6 n=2 Tax=Lepisosteus oculatus TaxID=7918 RepID=W5MY52_LEPOC|nr:PREDICTED: putative methyltransferase NSUN6 isoform X1 [Lepisosteus oculatus]XP_015209818.1 PREDICTED: putative methyltransferase NSUN6 isoform X1 [Lepisosteus oculatus]
MHCTVHEEMSVFPKITLRGDVKQYLGDVFKNKELLAVLGQEDAERRFEMLLSRLSHPPAFTSVRVNTHLASPEHVRRCLSEEIRKQQQMNSFSSHDVPIFNHPDVPDVLLIPVIGPRVSLERHSLEVVVGAQCGNAVLRGAHVFAPGILAAPKYMKMGDVVSVFSDIEGQCTRGAKEFQGKRVFIGNGIAEMSRSDIFCTDQPIKGIGIRMTEPVYFSPSFYNVLPNQVFLQNLPSAIVSHVLQPQAGERILDMCAAPGGKTTHIAALMGDEGEVIAMDKIANKVERIKQNAQMLGLNSIKVYCFNAIKALSGDPAGSSGGGPPFPPESFDRVLLDAPCSGLGQRPNMACTWSLKEITSYQPLQRQLFTTAVKLLKRGGVLVYSTCTITLAENEEQVAWALHHFPFLSLQRQEPHVGGGGMLGAGLSHDHLKLLQRFNPVWATTEGFTLHPEEYEHTQGTKSDLIHLANKDTIGFFIAKFVKT